MIKIRVEYYGVLEGICGTRWEDIHLNDGNATISDTFPILVDRHGNLEEHLEHVVFAVDNKLLLRDASLRDGSILALLPPVSGG